MGSEGGQHQVPTAKCERVCVCADDGKTPCVLARTPREWILWQVERRERN